MSKRNKKCLDHAGPQHDARSPAAHGMRRPIDPGIVLGVILAAAVFVVFGQTLRFGFVAYDDDQYVFANRYIRDGITTQGMRWMLTNHHVGNWHPLTTLSHMLDCTLFGLDAGGHHLVNVLLHAATSVLLLIVLRRLTGRLWPSALAAALFALHPLRVESVAWVSERKDVLSGLFFVLTLLAYERYARRPFSLGRYAAVMVLFALGLMSKPMLVTMPMVLLLLDYWPLRRFTAGDGPADVHPYGMTVNAKVQAAGQTGSGLSNHPVRRVWPLILEKLPLLALSTVFSVVTVHMQQITIESTQSLPVGWRVGNALLSYGTYLWNWVWPVGLSPFYPHPRHTLAIGHAMASAALLAGLTFAVLAVRRRHPYLLFGWLWYVGMLVPVIGLVQVGSQARADRYTYLPMIGLGVALIWWIADIAARSNHRKWLGGAVVTLLVGLMLRSGVQVGHWKDTVTLWSHTLEYNPDNALAHLNIGSEYATLGRHAEALKHFRRVVELRPNQAAGHNNLALSMMELGHVDQAMPHFERAIELDPNFTEAHYNRGNAWSMKQKYAEAADCFRDAMACNPQFAPAHNNLGAALDAMGEHEEAIDCYHRALALNPRYADAHFNCGNALAQLGRLEAAMDCWEQTLEINPRYAKAHLQLGTSLYLQQKVDLAILHFQQAVQIQPDFEQAWQHLQVALQERARQSGTAQR